MLNSQQARAYEKMLSIIPTRNTGRFSVLELGTRRWGDSPTHHRHLFPEWVDYTMADFLDGEDVDIVSDAHRLTEFPDDRFDAVISFSTYEHLEWPWVATQAIYRVLKPGGWTFHQTHQSFPVHGYPSDYTRWTDKGMEAMFGWAGYEVIEASMFEPAKIVPRPDYPVLDATAPVYLGVCILAVKP